jgi:hypothetical protein
MPSRGSHRAHLRECYPDLYRNKAKDSPNRRGGVCSGGRYGAAAALVAIGLVGLWLAVIVAITTPVGQGQRFGTFASPARHILSVATVVVLGLVILVAQARLIRVRDWVTRSVV